VVCHFSTGNYWALLFEGDDDVSVTVNAERYNHMLETFFLPEMRRRNWNMARTWFQQDDATAHTARLEYGENMVSAGRCHSPYGTIGIWREHGFSRTVPQPIRHDWNMARTWFQQEHSPYGTTLTEHPTLCIPRTTSLSVW
jgi:hypothetical protein